MISTVIILISLFVILYLRLRGRDFYFIPLDNPKDKDDWIGNGQFEYSRVNKSFQMTQAEPGFIYSKCLDWSDYKCEFDFKIRNTCLGVILRAVNLSNYVMIQITQEGIRPHVRINGGWKYWEAEEVGLKFSNNLSLEDWYKCQLVCDKNIINIKITHSRNKLLDREWEIPKGSITFTYKVSEEATPVMIPFPINLEYGSAGFRESGQEKALIKNFLLEKV